MWKDWRGNRDAIDSGTLTFGAFTWLLDLFCLSLSIRGTLIVELTLLVVTCCLGHSASIARPALPSSAYSSPNSISEVYTLWRRAENFCFTTLQIYLNWAGDISTGSEKRHSVSTGSTAVVVCSLDPSGHAGSVECYLSWYDALTGWVNHLGSSLLVMFRWTISIVPVTI